MYSHLYSSGVNSAIITDSLIAMYFESFAYISARHADTVTYATKVKSLCRSGMSYHAIR
ncbi:hypothetical protein [Clostridium thermosuccinogenes]|uniref:hypothetical protein n=1 Tax=Clostridium thermosuccinogenes TaxID=84032 RepID=UPI001A9A500C|nr:hypothetical protein [Pseudoclostridium thermosuccinogenes]